MRIDETRELNDDELKSELTQQERALMNLRFRRATMQLQDVTEIRKTRRTLARLMTVVREREIVAQMSDEEKGD
jgi:large subunit ribosomal protein L29